MPFGFNLIHSPNEPELERATAELYLEKGVRLIEASAYIDLTQPLVKYRVQGIHRGQDGRGKSLGRDARSDGKDHVSVVRLCPTSVDA